MKRAIKIAIAGVGNLVADIADCLLQDGFEISNLVVSPKSKPHEIENLVKYAHEKNINLAYDFDCLSNEEIVFTPNYRTIIPKEIFAKHLFINVHYALLPRFRGIHPVQAGLINNDKAFGYTIHQVDEGIDSGPVYYQYLFEADPGGNITDILGNLTNHLLRNLAAALRAIADKSLLPVPQDESKAVYCASRKPEDGIIDWTGNSAGIVGLIKALTPPHYPGATTTFKGKQVVIAAASLYYCEPYIHTPGQVLLVKDETILVKTGDTAIWVEKLYDPVSEKIVFPIRLHKFVSGQRLI